MFMQGMRPGFLLGGFRGDGSMTDGDAVDLRARALEQRQAELDRAVKVVGKHHEHDALRLQVSRLLHSQLLDYKHNSPANVKKSVSLLLRLCQNIVDHPDDEKYRKVRAATTAFDMNISAYPAALQLLSLLGWRARVVDCEKHWCFDHPTGSEPLKLLEESLPELRKALSEVEGKERAMLKQSDKKAEDQKRRKAVLSHIHDDYESRREVQERQVFAAEAAKVLKAPIDTEEAVQGRPSSGSPTD